MVIVMALFVVPKLMEYMPDFDPLLIIIGLFIVAAAAQQLGFQTAPADADGDRPSQGGRSGASRRQHEEPQADQPKEMLREAERCLEQSSWAKAEELARRLADLDPENARAWEILATAQKWDGRREEAVATLRKARDLYEVDSEAMRALAKELEGGPDPAAVAAECEEKAKDFFGRRQFDQAIDWYTKALDACGDSPAGADEGDTKLRLLRRRAECAQQLQDWGTCRRDATTVLQACPDDLRALLQRAAANEALEQFGKALEDARKLLSMDPKNSAANRIVHSCQQALR